MPEQRPRDLIAARARLLADAGVSSPQRDASILLAHVCGVDEGELQRLDLLGRSVPDGDVERFDALIDERARRVPVQHLTGVAPFRRLELAVGPGVFVPRPETEMLVDLVLAELPIGGTVVDLCTGSGALAVAIASERPDATVIAVEIDELAAAWAARNIADLGVTVDLRVEDARSAVPDLEGRVDVVVSNPPYVPTDMVPKEPEVAEHDPQIALYGGSPDGLLFPVQIAERASRLLKPGGVLVMEHADVQGQALPKALLDGRGFDRAQDVDDATSRPRVTVARREGGARFVAPTSLAERPFRRRRTVRLVVMDDDDRLLLLKDSDQGTELPVIWWTTPGGGIDPGEDLRTAASRELREETGYVARPEAFVGPLAERTVMHGYSDQIVEQHDTFFGLRVTAFDVDPAALTPEEQITLQGWRWWSLDDLASTTERVWPEELPELARALRAGRTCRLADVEESSVPLDAE